MAFAVSGAPSSADAPTDRTRRQQHRSGVALAVVDKGCVTSTLSPTRSRPANGPRSATVTFKARIPAGNASQPQAPSTPARRVGPADAGRMISPASISADSTAPSNACAASGSRLARGAQAAEPAVAAGAIRPAACPPPDPRPPPVVRQRARWPPPARARLVRHVRAPPRPWPGPLPAPARRRQNGATPASTGFSSCPAPDPYAAALFHRGRGPLQCRAVRSQRCAAPAGTRAARQPASRRRRCAKACARRGDKALRQICSRTRRPSSWISKSSFRLASAGSHAGGTKAAGAPSRT